MADLAAPVAGDIQPVRWGPNAQITAPAGAAILPGQPVYQDANGKFQLADASAAGTLGKPGQRGIAISKASEANITITVVTDGLIDMGDMFTATAIGAAVYASNTTGVLADAAGDNVWIVGYVQAAFGNTTPDKLLNVRP